VRLKPKVKSVLGFLCLAFIATASFSFVPFIKSASAAVDPEPKCTSFVYPGKVLIDKPTVSRNEPFKVVIEADIRSGVDKTVCAPRTDIVFTIAYWNSTSATATKYYQVDLRAKFIDHGSNGSFYVGDTVKPIDILPNLKVTDETTLYIYGGMNKPRTEALTEGRELKIVKGDDVNHPISDQIAEENAHSDVLNTYRNPPAVGDGSVGGLHCVEYIASSLETDRTPPIKLTTSNQGSDIKLNFSITVGQQYRDKCADQKIQFDIWEATPHAPDAVAGAVDGDFGIIVQNIAASPMKDSDGNFTGFLAGYTVVPGAILNASEKTKVANGEAISARLRVRVRDMDRNTWSYTNLGPQVGEDVPVTFTNKLEEVSAADPNFKPNSGVAGAAGISEENATKTAGGIIDFIADILLTLVSFINSFIFYIFSYVVLPLLSALLSIRTYTDAFALVILPGWELLRNLANIFFIVVLLVIGLATIFRLPRYQYRSLLLNVILAALLVNFSLIITQSVIAIAETVQHQFLPPEEGGVAINVIANRLMIAPAEQSAVTPKGIDDRFTDSLSRLVFPFFYLSLTLMAFVVMTSLVFFVLVRMLVIWVLLMTSPIAFVAWILPDTKKWTEKWKDNLFRYAPFVAILGFFLNIAAFVAQQQAGILQGLYNVNGDSGLANFISRIATNLFVMGFLVAGVIFAQSAGVYGGKALGKYAKGAGALPFKALGGAVGGASKFGADYVFGGSRVDPRVWKKSFKDYTEGQKKKRYENRRAKQGNWAPENLIKNLDPFQGQNWSRVGRNLFYLRGHRAQAIKLAAAEEKEKILTDAERAERATKIANKNTLRTSATGSLTKLSASQEIEYAEAQELYKNLSAQSTSLKAEAVILKEEAAHLAGQAKLDKQNEARKKENLANQLDKLKGIIDDTPLGADVNLSELTQETRDHVKDQIEKQEAVLSEEITKITEEITKDDKRREDNKVSSPVGPDEKKKFQEEVRTYRANVAKAKLPDDYYARDLDLRREREKAKLDEDVDDPGELADRAVEAHGMKDRARFAAIAKRMAKDGNYDILAGKFGYKDGAEDFENFFKNTVPEAGFNKKQMFQLAAAVSKANEGNNLYNTARMVTIKGNDYDWTKLEDRMDKIAKALSGKTTNTVLSNAKINTFINTKPNGDPELTKYGIEFFNSITEENADRYMKNLPPKVAKAIFDTPEWKQKLAGAHPKVIEGINKAASRVK
jgi:hypothetical protein